MDKPKIVAQICKLIICPTVYEIGDGNYIVQGSVLSEGQRKQLEMAENEDAVIIPFELLESLRQYLESHG